jgi:tetratricopeptide (TPR) repeat protein
MNLRSAKGGRHPEGACRRAGGIVAALLALTVALGLGAPPAWADVPAPAEEARALFKKGDYKGALAALERAQATKPDPRLFWNMAACETRLGDHAKAMAHVERYLASASGLTREERNQATQFLTAAKAFVGTVTVTSNVAGTEIAIDGELAGTTPLSKAIYVDEGRHRVRFARTGYVAVEREEQVLAGGDLRWAVELAPEAPPAPPPAAPAPPEEGRARRLGPLVLGGSGLVVAGVGGVLVGISLGHASTLRDDCGTACAPDRWGKFRTMQIAGDVLLVAGVAASAGAVVWWLLPPRPARASAWLAPMIAGVAAGGSW